MRGPKVSVFMLTYNHERFVRQALDAVLAQDYPEIEIVVSDDASTDATQLILREYGCRWPDRFRLLLGATNVGIVANSNRALAACTGEYIAWTAGDDLMLPGKLRRQVEFMERHAGCVLSYHDLEVFDSETGATLAFFNSGPRGHIPREGDAATIVRHGVFLGGCSVLGRRVACPPSGYDTRLRYASDWLMWVEMATRGDVRFIPEVLGRYRRHAGNITRRTADVLTDELTTLDIVESRYPHLAAHARHRRGQILVREALLAWKARRWAAGARLLARGLRLGGVIATAREVAEERRFRRTTPGGRAASGR
jgi:glycosyltransferase involved in cell wall biosynthesis